MIVSKNQGALFDNGCWTGREATFTDARHMPLHSWYPYLEGYSVEFVERMYSNFMPEFGSILDPFAGTGTTSVATAILGRHSGYCETNPFLRDLLALKLECLALSTARRKSVADEVSALGRDLASELDAYSEDPSLDDAYGKAFESSHYFPPETYSAILRYRALCDALSTHDTMLSRLAYAAALRNIIPASFLKRAGDLRFKTKRELQKGLPGFIELVSDTLDNIAADLRSLPLAQFSSEQACADARSLLAAPISKEYDGVITSPPYLNGTNYIRNTKLELWFGRYIESPEGLRKLRDMMVVSGINDVKRSNHPKNFPDECYNIVRELEKNAYDSRIPHMVAGYFADMEKVFRGLQMHMRTDAIACIDIGDSSYSGIRVPTPEVLRRTAERLGFGLLTSVPLRERKSRDQSKLIQEVIVLKNRKVFE